jgi:hypothetical protein
MKNLLSGLVMFLSYSMVIQAVSEMWRGVRFFWDPDFAEMTVKQVQELKKAGIFGGNQKNIAKALYNLRKPLSFESPKTGNVFWSLRDTYLKDMKDTELFKFYSDGLRVLDSKSRF